MLPMKAAVCEQYGGPDVLELLDDLPIPQVGPNGVLVRVKAASVNPVDWKLRSGLLDAVRPVVFPVIWGMDLSGVVTEVGTAVTLFKPGDEVYGYKDGYVGKTFRGTYAEYVVIPEKSLAKKPGNLGYNEAAAVPLAALTAWQALLNQGKLKPGQRALIHAGAGGVGSFAIQIAKAFGVYVAATASTKNQDLLHQLGADMPIDYTCERIEQIRPKFDVVLDGVGKSVWPSSLAALKTGGRLITLTAPIPDEPAGKLRFFATALAGLASGTTRAALTGKRLLMTQVKPRGGELEKITALIEAGKIKLVIQEVFPLERLADAHRLSETNRVRGKLVITISN